MAAPVVLPAGLRGSRRRLLGGLCGLMIARTGVAQSLYAQSVARALGSPAAGTEFLILDLRTNNILVDQFADSSRPIPVGSLLKPFVAFAYSRTSGVFPEVTCRGHADRCWSAPGHGALDLVHAMEQSCNAYFLALARTLQPADIPYLPAPPRDATPATLIGLTPEWLIAPFTLALGFAALLNAQTTPALDAIRDGMRLCALHGTAAQVGAHAGGVLAKTGTASCVQGCRASGDGLIVVAAPARRPTLLVLVRRRGTTGAATALDAGALLARLESLHAF